MGFRFRRSFRVFPGLRINVSKSGVSESIGGRGAWFTIGPRGTRTTVGIPGTGLGYTQQNSRGVSAWVAIALAVVAIVVVLVFAA